MTRRHAVAAAALLLAVAGCAEEDDGHLVLVSGRDDHGFVAMAPVPLVDRPQGTRDVGGLADGTLARVHRVDGQWLEVEAVEGRPARGWVDDVRLRAVVHLVGPPPSCVPALDGRAVEAGAQAMVLDLRGTTARVRLVRGGATAAVERAQVRELAPTSQECPALRGATTAQPRDQ